ncbi:MAG: plasmid pRiA4b ORF-3 family protein [Armatimonadota bacterium]|nr:plasmid pRiA4b ORF-3 family protein [Armatimonadota bacterium]
MGKPKAKPEDVIYRLRISIVGSEPEIWRRVDVPGQATLSDLHGIIQRTMNWENYHLHQFEIHDELYMPQAPVELNLEMAESADETEACLIDLDLAAGSSFEYVYDFGDWWVHEIRVEEVLERDPQHRYPVCHDGEMAGPPEDVGGLWGYYEMLEALEDPEHPEHEMYTDWIEEWDPEDFDAEAVNKRLMRIKLAGA